MTSNKKQGSNWRLRLKVAALVFAIAVGYLIYNKYKDREWASWTGFGETQVVTENIEINEQGQVQRITESKQNNSGKTLWDWLELLIVPVLIAGFGLWFQSEQDKRERAIAQINSAEEAIEAYLKSMADILLNEELKKELFPNKSKVILGVSIEDKEDKDNSVRDVARALTIVILRRLEGDRRHQDVILRFLRDAELHEFILKNAHLSEMDLSGTSLWRFNLSGAKLRNTNLLKADLEQTNLKQANLKQANLEQANLKQADLKQANLEQVNLKKTCLIETNLQFNNVLIKFWMFLINMNYLVGFLFCCKSLTNQQIKSAYNWEEAIYKGEWHREQNTGTWVAKNEQAEQDNKKFIEELKKAKSSDSTKEQPDCSRWKR